MSLHDMTCEEIKWWWWWWWVTQTRLQRSPPHASVSAFSDAWWNLLYNKYVGPPYCRAKVYAGRVACPPDESRSACWLDRQTDGQTSYRYITLSAGCAVSVIKLSLLRKSKVWQFPNITWTMSSYKPDNTRKSEYLRHSRLKSTLCRYGKEHVHRLKFSCISVNWIPKSQVHFHFLHQSTTGVSIKDYKQQVCQA